MAIIRIEEIVRWNSFNEIVLHGTRVLGLAWLEARPGVQLIFLLRFLSGVFIAAGATGAFSWELVAVTAACWVATTTTVYLVNGISDIPEDSVNGSRRPIASGTLPLRSAAKVAAMTAAVASVGAALVGDGWTLLLTLVMLSLGWAYSMGPRPLKKRMSGFLCTAMIGGMLTYLAGWHSVGSPEIHLDLVLFGVAMSLWMGFGGATKDLSDVEGDRRAGRRTWPVVLGERRARQAMASAAVVTGAGFVTASLVAVPGLLLPSSMLLLGSVLLAMTALSGSSRGGRDACRRPYKVFMVTQYAAHLTLFAEFIL